MQTTALVPYARLPRAYHGHHIASSTVDAFGRAHWLLAEREPQHQEPYDATVVTVDDDRHWTTELSAVAWRLPRIDSLPDGGFVVAGVRCRGEELNAQIFDALGRESWSFQVDDAIEHLLVSAAGDIWVGHFDEHPMGIRRWSPTGELLTEVGQVPGGPWITDCYALNVSESVAWACTYTHFPLLEIRPDRETMAYSNPVRGANALAVHGDRIVYFSGYRDERDRLVTAELAEGEVRPLATGRLTRPDGLRIGRRRLVSRGPRIYVQERPGTTWSVLDISTTR